MGDTKKKLSVKIIEIENLKKTRFSFIDDEILRENIAIKMQYVVFLVSLEEEYDLPGAVTYTTFKTIIIYTASILEALVHYKLRQLVKNKKINEDVIFGKDEKLSIMKKYQRISTTEEIFGIKRTVKPKKLSDTTDFCQLNRAAKRCGLFTDNIFNKAEEIRTARNRIHPYFLKEVDDKYTKKNIADFFAAASVIIERIENYEG